MSSPPSLTASLFSPLLYCSSDRRLLHSFPTRRSSDLHCWRAWHPRSRSWLPRACSREQARPSRCPRRWRPSCCSSPRSEEHTSELQSRGQLVCRLLLEKKKLIHLLFRVPTRIFWLVPT